MRPLFVGLMISLAAGCGGGGGQSSVRGKVHFPDGTPLTAGRIVAESPAHNVSATGYIGKDGTFELGTKTNNDGVPAGTWNVVILAAEIQPETYPDKPNTKKATPMIHARYLKKETSSLSFKVPDQTNWDITVNKP